MSQSVKLLNSKEIIERLREIHKQYDVTVFIPQQTTPITRRSSSSVYEGQPIIVEYSNQLKH